MPNDILTGETSGFMFKQPLYDKLKYTALVLLPALATLYFTVGKIWGLPSVEEVMGTIVALSTFLGVLLKISTSNYNSSNAKYDGVIDITANAEGAKMYSLELDSDPYELDSKKDVIFKVSPSTETY